MIDCHTHIFPDKIAESTLAMLSKRSGFKPYTLGNLADTKLKMQAWGIEKFIILPVVTNPKQQKAVNDFAACCQDQQVLAFGSVHPAASDALAEINRIKKLGLIGIKIHPQYQLTFIDDPAYIAIIQEAAGLGLPIIFHAGYDPGLPPPIYAPPAKVANLLKQLTNLDNLVLIAAHMGGLKEYEQVKEHLWHQNIYFDISFALHFLSDAQITEMILAHGSERFLFGSDCPWHCPELTANHFKQLPLSEQVKEQILHLNARRIWPQLGE